MNPSPKRQRAERKGRMAELIASLYLNLKGYRILKRRLATPLGEVDLVAKRQNSLVFIEVKYRQNLDQGMYAVTPHQQKRIERGAAYFLKRFPITPRTEIRFDVICLYGFKLKHIEHAWRIA